MTQQIRMRGLVFLLAAGALTNWSAAQPPTPPQSAPAAAAKPDKEEGPKRFREFKDVVKDMKEIEGFFTLYRFDPSDKNRDPETLYAKIPAKMLNEDMLFATSISKGGRLTGWMWTEYLFRWQVVGNQLKMVIPDTRYIAKDDQPVADAIKRTYGDSFAAAVPILSMTPAGDVLIDLGPLLKSDIAGVSGLGEGRIRPELSTWTKVKAFPENILIETDLAVSSGQGGSEIGVAYAFQKLPKLGSYKPREADPRIGYFLTSRVDWAKPNSEREVAERYINRWQLEKRDPSLELSPPVKPIVFIIEKTVPIQWRRWVRAGILEWNTAFEKIGFSDAIVVQQQTDDNEYASYDPEDSRYNFVRWTVTGNALAVGPSRADPRTGQILDADIVIDDAWVRFYVTNYDTFGPHTFAQMKGADYDLLNEKYPDFLPDFLKPDKNAAAEISPFELRQKALAAMPYTPQNHRCNAHCDLAEGMGDQLMMAQAMMISTGMGRKVPERLVGEAVQEVVAHEVGHTLGLRHNFKASAWLSLDEVKKRRIEGGPTTSSVMDYNPLLFFIDDNYETIKHFISPELGPYDMWAIEYGYKVPGKEDKGEDEMLKAIAARSTEPALAFATDEDTTGAFSPDPLSNRYDYSSDPVAWTRQRIDLCEKLVTNVNDWSIRSGEPRYFLTQAYNTLLSQKGRNIGYITRVVSGQYFHRDHAGDPNARPAFELLDPELQRSALKALGETVFADDFGKASPELLNNLAPSRWWDIGAFPSTRIDYPIHERILSVQAAALVDLVSPPVLQRVYDAEMKSSAENKFTAAELIRSVRDMIWRHVADKPTGSYTDAKPLIPSTARNLQKLHLTLLLNLAQMPPGSGTSPDLNGMVRHALRELSGRLEKVGAQPNVDFATAAHLSECKSRIDRVLNAQFQAR